MNKENRITRIVVSNHLRAVLSAFLVTFLWSTSWVLIKNSLGEIPPVTFAGLRYTLAFFILLPFMWKQKSVVNTLSKKTWIKLGLLGLVFYALTQGGVFISLKFLESVTFSLMLNFSTLLVAFFGMIALKEFPARIQWAGIGIFSFGIFTYFYPLSLPQGGLLGLAVGGMTVCANAVASILGREANREKTIPPLVVTTISMGVGAFILLVSGVTIEGWPSISPQGWITIAWLAVVNTAFAFTLWNKTQQTLSAVESSIINNTMLIQIAILAWIFLGEQITLREIGGLLLVMAGTLMVQLAHPN